jgi:hypothetical protein
VVDDNKYRGRFGDHSTPMPDALASTVAWYRSAVLAPPAETPAHRLPTY